MNKIDADNLIKYYEIHNRKRNGDNPTRIACYLKIDYRTVKKYLFMREEEYIEFLEAQSIRIKKLDEYEKYIKIRLEECPSHPLSFMITLLQKSIKPNNFDAMKKSIVSLLFVLFLLLASSPGVFTQEIKGGVVEYDQTNYYKFEKVGKENIDNFISRLPSSTIDHKVLIFNSKHSLYKQGFVPEDPTLSRQKIGIKRLSFLNPPVVKLWEVYTDLRTGDQVQQLEFMTRFFLMEEKDGQKAWKIGTEQVKILDYNCQKATMEDGDQTITAWFTPEIPVSIGPANYAGLPGLILSVEIDGKNIFLATSVDLTEPDQKIKKIREGTKVDQEKLDKIIAEKTEEWAGERESRIWGTNRK